MAVEIGSRKLVHHKCGHPLWTKVFDRLTVPEGSQAASNGEKVILHYYDAHPDSSTPDLIVFLCPGCGQPLKLWWDA